MQPWVIVAIGVVVAAVISARPLMRLREPKRNDRLKITLSIAVIFTAAIIALTRRPRQVTGETASRGLQGGTRYVRSISNLYRSSGGAQCTVRAPPAPFGGAYKPYVVPRDLTVGGSADVVPIVAPVADAVPTFAPVTEAVPIVAPVAEAVSTFAPVAEAVSTFAPVADVVVGGTLKLVGDF